MEINDKTIKLLTELELYNSNKITDWAIKCLEAGFDSKSLRMLASMQDYYSSSEYGDYLQRSLKELGWDKIERKEYLLRYAKIVAKQITGNEKDYFEAAREIYKIGLELVYPAELREWIDIDEMIWSYNYFLKTGKKDYYYQDKETIIEEIRRLAKELISDK